MSAESGPRRRFSSGRVPAPADSVRLDDPKAFAAVVGEAVRRARQSLGWTQAHLAEAAGFSPNYIARLERGELGPSLFVASHLCETLSIDLNDLLQRGPASAAHPRSTRRRVAQ